MAKQILDDEDKDTSPESPESLAENDSESQPSDKDVIDTASTKLDPDIQAMSDQLEAARPSDKDSSTSESTDSDDTSDNDDSDEDSPNQDPSKIQNPEVARLQALLDQATGKTPVESRMNSRDAIAALLGKKQQELSSAQELSNKLEYLANMNRAGETISNGLAPMAHRQADNEGYKAALAQAQQPVTNILQKQQFTNQALKDSAEQQQLSNEMDRNDPNSDVSKLAVQLAQQSAPGLQIKPGMTAANLDKILPGIEKSADRQLQRQNVKAIADQNNLTKQMMNQGRQDAKDAAQQASQEKNDESTQQKFGKQLNTLSQSSRSPIGRAASAQISIKRLQDIINDPHATNEDLNNAYTDMTAVISGASPGMGAVAHNSYNTLQNQMANMKQYWTSAPQAPVMPEIKAHVGDLANRMQAISDNVINQHLGTTATSFTGWMKRHPDEARDMMRSAAGSSSDQPISTPSTSTASAPKATTQPQAPTAPNEVVRVTKDGRPAVFDASTKKFLRYQ